MKLKHVLTYSLTSCLFLGSATINAAIDASAENVQVSLTCLEGNASLDNCFTNLADLSGWINNTRRPDSSSPLQVNVGPGSFTGPLQLSCDAASGYTGHTSIKGSGAGQTIIEGSSNYISPIVVNNCTELNFSDLKTTTEYYGGVVWAGGGNSRWFNVEIEAKARAWYENQCGAEKGSHYWYSSKLNAIPVFSLGKTYRATCDESWFFGSEISLTVPVGVNGSGAAIVANTNGIVHLYGSVLRALVDGTGGLSAVEVGVTSGWPGVTGGEVHIHGTGIDVISNTGHDAVVFKASANGMIHADSSAYNMSTTGNKTRILNNGGTVKAPYQWSQSNQPPQVASVTGSDLAVETNCDEKSCHDEDTGTETHLLIYNANCNFAGHGPWFDVVTRKCRGDMIN